MTLTKTNEEKLNLETISWGGMNWTNIQGPTAREIEYLAKNYPFHPYDLDDTLSRTQRPKIDEYKEYLFLILHFQVFNKQTRVSGHTQLSVFIGDNYLITIHNGELKPITRLFRLCQEDEKARQENFSYGSGYLLYRIIDRMVDAYFPVMDKILKLMDEVEDQVFDENVEAAQELSILRRDIITQRRIIWPLRTVVASLENKLKRFTRMDLTVYYGDLMDHMNKICETLDEAREVIEVFKDTDYLLSTDRLNRIVRTLTVLGTVVLPFLIISSMYGMNVVLPGGIEGSGDFRPFILLLVVMAAFAGGALYFFRRRRWI